MSPSRIKEPRLRVLIVDSYDEREMYAEALRAYGFSVETASTVGEALTMVEARENDVIVHGLMFPDESGVDLARHLAESERTRDVPRIVLSGFTDSENLKIARATGCRTLLIKPCQPRRLASAIQRALPDATRLSRLADNRRLWRSSGRRRATGTHSAG